MGNSSGDDLEKMYRLVDLEETAAGLIREVRVPLSALIRYAALIQSACSEDNVRAYTGKVSADALHVSDLLDKVAALSRKKAGSAEDPVDVTTILRQTVSLFSYQLRARNIPLYTSFHEGALPVRGCPVQLQQAFYIGLLNALQLFISSPGAAGITLASRPDAQVIRISMAVEGPGMLMFGGQDPLKQFFGAIGKGMGPGWYTLNRNIEAQGGKVMVAGGEGVSFIMELPLAEVGGSPGAGIAGGESEGDAVSDQRSALIIDDEEMSGKVTAEMMTHLGYESVRVLDPAAALPLLRERRFDLIMVDYLMPRMDGVSFIRNHAPLLRDSQIVLMTGASSFDPSLLPGDLAVRILIKPFGFRELECLTLETGK